MILNSRIITTVIIICALVQPFIIWKHFYGNTDVKVSIPTNTTPERRIVESMQFACSPYTAQQRADYIDSCIGNFEVIGHSAEEIMGICDFNAEEVFCENRPAIITQELQTKEEWVDIKVVIDWGKDEKKEQTLD